MNDSIELTRVLFLDIETVSLEASYADLDDEWKELWKLKSKQLDRGASKSLSEADFTTTYEEKAAIYSEFGKIVCISVGILLRDSDSRTLNLRLTSFKQEKEKELLEAFSKMLEQYYPDPTTHFLCGHNLREFDVPYLCRRMVVNQVKLPGLLQLSGKKPWETKYLLDTLELWRFGDYKNYTSIKLLTKLLNVPSPKDDIDGSDVGRIYWQEKDLDRIAVYCEKDVLAVTQLLLRFKGLPLLESMDIVHV